MTKKYRLYAAFSVFLLLQLSNFRVLIFIGAGSSMGTMWDLADVTMGFMAIINLPVICILGGPALRALDDYTEQRDAGKNPEFKASKIGLTQKLDYWQD